MPLDIFKYKQNMIKGTCNMDCQLVNPKSCYSEPPEFPPDTPVLSNTHQTGNVLTVVTIHGVCIDTLS